MNKATVKGYVYILLYFSFIKQYRCEKVITAKIWAHITYPQSGFEMDVAFTDLVTEWNRSLLHFWSIVLIQKKKRSLNVMLQTLRIKFICNIMSTFKGKNSLRNLYIDFSYFSYKFYLFIVYLGLFIICGLQNGILFVREYRVWARTHTQTLAKYEFKWIV